MASFSHSSTKST